MLAQLEPIIGIEVHSQLSTKSKMFCSCANNYAGAEPNTHVCPVCMGAPGTLPIINKKAFEYGIMACLALNCNISEFTMFDRKNYPYPDLVKGYQISQYNFPLGTNGYIMIETPYSNKKIRIRRIHLEEDTARLLHFEKEHGDSYTLMDVNRAGAPLMEIVSEPDVNSPEEAVSYLKSLRDILLFLGISTCNMENGALRLEANVSLKRKDENEFGARVEIKNLNSFQSVKDAIDYQILLQTELINSGQKVIQQTVGWDQNKHKTIIQRTKEEAHDYRYFPEPDLPPVKIAQEWLLRIKNTMPELRLQKQKRFSSQMGLDTYTADVLTQTKERAVFFEKCFALYPNAKVLANWIISDLLGLLNKENLEINQTHITPESLVELLTTIDKGDINIKIAKGVLEDMFITGKTPQVIIEEKNLVQITDESAIIDFVEEALRKNQQIVEEYKNGKTKSFTFLVGQVMKISKGKANPALVNKILTEKLNTLNT